MQEGLVITTIAYKGNFYTIAKASIDITANGKPTTIVAEGLARRSAVDKPNDIRGETIAKGRAEKALNLKLSGMIKGNNIFRIRKGRKTKDLMVA